MKLRQASRQIVDHPLILPLYVPTLLVSLAWGVRNPILPLYAAQEFGASYAVVGLVLAAERLGQLLSDVPGGMILGRFGQKNTMLGGLLIAAVMTLALLWAGTVPELLVYRLASGFGFAIFNVARHAYMADEIPKAQRGRAVALFGGLLRIGRFGGPLIGGAVAVAFGLRLPFAVMTAFTLLALLVVWGSLAADESNEALPALTLGRYTRQLALTLQAEWRPLLSAGSGFLLLQIVRAGPDAIIPLYGADVLGLNVAQIGWVMGISGALDMALFYPTGMIMDRLGRKRAVVPSFLTMAAGLGLVPLSGGFTGLILAAGLLGIGNGLGSGTMMTLGADLSPPGRHGEFLGLWHLIGDTGSTVGPLLIGAVAGAMALSAAALVVSGLGFGGGLLFLRTVPETLRRPES